jgi:hypothetical protein
MPQLTGAGAECKRHKIRCEFRAGETTCTKCTRSGIKCVVNDFSQKFVDDDVMYVLTPARPFGELWSYQGLR